jgi:hypothetical protein
VIALAAVTTPLAMRPVPASVLLAKTAAMQVTLKTKSWEIIGGLLT